MMTKEVKASFFDLLSNSWGTFKKHLIFFLIIASFLTFLQSPWGLEEMFMSSETVRGPVSISEVSVNTTAGEKLLSLGLIILTIFSFVSLFLLYFIFTILLAKEPSYKKNIKKMFQSFFSIFWIAVIMYAIFSYLFMMFVFTFEDYSYGIGLALYLLFAYTLFFFWFFFPQALLFEGKKDTDALSYSYHIVKNSWKKVLFYTLFCIVFNILAFFLFKQFDSSLMGTVGDFFFHLISPFEVIFLTHLFFALQKEQKAQIQSADAK